MNSALCQKFGYKFCKFCVPDLSIFPWLLHSSRHHRGKTGNWDFGKLKGGDNEFHSLPLLKRPDQTCSKCVALSEFWYRTYGIPTTALDRILIAFQSTVLKVPSTEPSFCWFCLFELTL